MHGRGIGSEAEDKEWVSKRVGMDRLRDGQAQGRMGMEEQGGAGRSREEQGGAGRSREEQGVRGGGDGRGGGSG